MSSNQDKKINDLYQRIRFLEAHTTHYCPIVSSKEIKQCIIDRLNELGVSAYEVAIRADVSYNSFKKLYLDVDDPESRPSLRPEDLMKVGRLIGIKIKPTLILQDASKIDRTKLLNEKYIPHGKRKKNKKLD